MRFGLKWRSVYWGLALGLFILAYVMGTVVPLSVEQANNIRQGLTEKNKNLNDLGIFVNNIIPSLEMFIPAAGVAIGAYAAVSTGQVFNAFALANPVLKTISPLSLLITPFAIMEIFAYAIAMSRSAMLAYFLIKRKWRSTWKGYIIPTIIEIGIVILILFIGSIVEWQGMAQH